MDMHYAVKRRQDAYVHAVKRRQKVYVLKNTIVHWLGERGIYLNIIILYFYLFNTSKF